MRYSNYITSNGSHSRLASSEQRKVSLATENAECLYPYKDYRLHSEQLQRVTEASYTLVTQSYGTAYAQSTLVGVYHRVT